MKYGIRTYCFFLIAAFSCLISGNLFSQQRDAQLYKGNKLYGQGKYKEAADLYEQSLKKKKSTEAIYNLGNAFYQQKNYEAAVKKYQESQKLSSNKQLRSASNHNIGNTYLEQKKWDEAIGYFKEALRQNPNAADSRYNLAYAMAMKKKEEQQKQNQQNKDQQNKDQKNNRNRMNLSLTINRKIRMNKVIRKSRTNKSKIKNPNQCPANSVRRRLIRF
jgi:tetratricopeptide (TPR) repeat protein